MSASVAPDPCIYGMLLLLVLAVAYGVVLVRVDRRSALLVGKKVVFIILVLSVPCIDKRIHS